MRIIFIVILFLLIYYIICNQNKIIFFDLDYEEDLIIKDIYIQQYNDKFNFLIDTMGFISGLFLSKNLRYDFILGNTFSPINSYRAFEGHMGELKLYNSERNKYFPIVIFKTYNKINFYDKNIKYKGVIGLALNYTEEVLLDEQYFFGENEKYSFIDYLKNDLNAINKEIFSIYKNKLIFGDINENKNHSNIHYCNCVDNIYDSFIYFFWNCDIETIIINNKINNDYDNLKISLVFDSLLKHNILSTNIKIGNIILNQINNEFLNLNICFINNSYIFCLNDYFDKIYNMNLKIFLNNETYIQLPFSIIVKNKYEKFFKLGIEIYEFNYDKNINIIKIGKKIFEYYYVSFDKINKKIGLQKLENISLFLDEKKNYKNLFIPKNKNYKLDKDKVFLIKVFFCIIIFISSFGILIIFYAKNNIEIQHSLSNRS